MIKKKKESASFGVIGLGRFGTALAITLAQAGKEVIAVDRDESRVKELRQYTDYAFVADSINSDTLKEIGIQNCDVVAVCLSDHMDTSILTVLNLVSLGVPKVIAEAASAEHGEILEKLGAEVVYPERDIAIRLAHRLETSKILDYVQVSEKVNISKMLVPESLVGKTVLEANLRKQFGVNIIAIENHAEVLRNVGPAYAFRKGDVLFLAGDKSGLNGLLEWAEKQ